MSLRLASLGLHLKDFFTLDYIKAGLLFLIYFFPPFIIIKTANSDEIKNKIVRIGFSTLMPFFYCFFIGTFLHDGNENESLIPHPWIYFPFVLLIYFLFLSGEGLKFKNFKVLKNLPKLVGIIPFSFMVLYNFSTQIYSEIKFEFGGGASYKKTLVVQMNPKDKPDIINAKVYYENENWIHFENNSNLMSIPKKHIIEQRIDKN